MKLHEEMLKQQKKTKEILLSILEVNEQIEISLRNGE